MLTVWPEFIKMSKAPLDVGDREGEVSQVQGGNGQ